MSLSKFFTYFSSESQIFFIIDKHFIVSENSIVWYWYPSSWKKKISSTRFFYSYNPLQSFHVCLENSVKKDPYHIYIDTLLIL